MPDPYLLPQVLVFQEFNDIAPEITNPLRAWVIGPNANLLRYDVDDEKSQAYIGLYDPVVGAAVGWPNRVAGGVIDQEYTKVYFDQARLLYFEDLVGDASVMAAVSGYHNRISGSVNFATRTGYPRDAALYDRDVAAGDLVYLRGSVGATTDELWTYVREVAAQVVAATIDAAAAAAANAATQIESNVVTQVGGDVNTLELTADLTDYSALVDGNINDTYTITVIQGSIGGDLTTARVRVQTASGVTYISSLAPAAAGASVLVDDRNLRLSWDATGSSVGVSVGVDLDDLIAGQQWTVAVGQAFTQPTVTSGGTYVGTRDNTYIVTVTSGGLFDAADISDRPRVSIRTSLGDDGVDDVIVNSAGDAVALSASGATLTFSVATGLRAGDRFYVPVNAATTGEANILVLGHNLSDTLQDATDLDVQLYIQADIQVPTYRTVPSPADNWTTSETEITILDGIYAFHDSWTSGGVAQPLPVMYGKMYVEYREWLPALVNEIGGIADISDIDDIPGPLDPDNPLKWAVSKAVANCNGTGVRYTAINDPDSLSDWTDALGLGTERSDLYSLVPLSTNRDVIDLFVAHVNAMSSPSRGKWRKVFVQLVAEPLEALITAALTSDLDVALATIADDPDTSGSQYTIVTIDGTNTGFLEAGVQSGDLLYTNFSIDSVGAPIYDQFVVDEVINETSLRLLTGPDAAVTVAQKFEVHHPRSKTELVTQLGEQAGTYGNRRVCAVWPDTIGSAGRTYAGFHVCAALAGLAGGVVPHQHLTNIQISGFDDLTRTTKLFNASQLDDLAAYGVWIVTQDVDGNIISRDALTSDMSSLQAKTEMVVRNVDSISFVMRGRLVGYIGRSNVVPSALDQIRIDLVSAIEFLRSNGYTARLGSQLIDADIIELRQHLTQRDRVVIAIALNIPFPMNVIELHLIA